MKKRLAISNPITKVCVTLLVGIGLSLGVPSALADSKSGSPKPSDSSKPSPTPKPAKPSPTPKPPKPTPTPKPGQCVVCDHEGGKNKDHSIPCDQVDKYLQDHPSSTRGPCNVTPVTNP